MRVFLTGMVFFALLMLGMWTVWLQSEALRIGYRMETIRQRLDAVKRENSALEVELASMKTPLALLERAGIENDVEADRIMPIWNLAWTRPLIPPDEYRLASRGGRGQENSAGRSPERCR